MRVLAIDQGTTATKGLVLNHKGHIESVTTLDHQQFYPAQGWVEHDARELLDNVLALAAAHPEVDAIGLDNQGETVVAWDRFTGEPLSPAIVWQDTRTQPEVDALKAAGHENDIISLTGLPLDSYFSASKIAWLYRIIGNAADLLAEGRLCISTTDAFFLHHLAGNGVTDTTTASRTSLMNIKTGQWEESLLSLFGVPQGVLPDIVPSCGIIGYFNKTPVTAAIVDQQASLYGHRCDKAGDVKITFGTGAFALAVCDQLPPPDTLNGVLPTIALTTESQTHYALDAGIYNAASAVNWSRQLGLFHDFDAINSFENRSAIEQGIAFVPALSGLASPYWDRQAGAMWIGMSLDTEKETLCQAVLEGIAFLAADLVDGLQRHTPPISTISVDGGLSNNPYFCQFLADCLQIQVSVPDTGEITAYGTALLAFKGIGQEVNVANEGTEIYIPRPLDESLRTVYKEAVSRSLQWHGTDE
ncbi:FGGY family carbohydrate kinase [Parasalinivibrio latis]|uniref:FGGY family carbohydrate kinase n=1 Tax=Parasalinivibrio latis TaxID=2952610 RepID=UPI0030E0CA70